MGTWNAGLFSNDITCDVKDTYMKFLEQQWGNQKAYQKTREEYEELIGTDEEALFWYALADTQWNVGRLIPEVKSNALAQIAQKGGCLLWGEDKRKLAKWEHTLQKLKDKMESPMPPEKAIKKPAEFDRHPWNIGDIYAYQFHTNISEEEGLLGKYIVFQKVGDVEWCDNMIFSAVQIFDHVFDAVPTVDNISELRILPLVSPTSPLCIEKYVPSFDWYLKATMLYMKKGQYPQKYFTFIGNQNISKTENASSEMTDFYWDKDGMEEWLVDYYASWRNIPY